jgi:hypothetical protein
MAHERDDKNGSGGQDWFLRRGGVVLGASFDVQPEDEVRFTRANAYLKRAYGQRLTHEESAAIKAAERMTFLDATGGGAIGEEVAFGFVLSHAPALISQLDKLALKIGERFGQLGELRAWQMIRDYADRALAVTMDEAGMLDFEPTPEQESQAAEADAWAASPEGQAAAAAMAPDGGPDGWSTVPPMNTANPHHPSKRGAP